MGVIGEWGDFNRTKCKLYFNLIGSQKGYITTVLLSPEQINGDPRRLKRLHWCERNTDVVHFMDTTYDVSLLVDLIWKLTGKRTIILYILSIWNDLFTGSTFYVSIWRYRKVPVSYKFTKLYTSSMILFKTICFCFLQCKIWFYEPIKTEYYFKTVDIKLTHFSCFELTFLLEMTLKLGNKLKMIQFCYNNLDSAW